VNERSEALDELVAIARRHGISAAEITAALAGSQPPGAPAEPRARAVLVRALGYLGATFVLVGIGVFVALQWEHMNSPARVVVTLGTGMAALALAIVAAREERYHEVANGLLLLAALLEPSGMLVAFNEFGSGGDWRLAGLVTSGAMAGQSAALRVKPLRSWAIFFTIVFAVLFFWTAFDLIDMDDEIAALVLGAGMLLAAIGLDRAGHGELSPPWYFFGPIALFYGLFEVVEETPFELLFVAVAAGLVYLAAFLRTRMLLFVSTIAILAYTGYYTSEHFADSIGWPLALIAFGIVLIGLSALAFKIDRTYVQGNR
jgi:hypothetical protein